ncbi:MAG: hypothetical protein ACK5RC_11290 [Curvibacter sp.]|nr:hypothetical protein [Curvibacter sp.]
MRVTALSRCLLLVPGLLSTALALAQPASSARPEAAQATEQKIERIRHEDAGTRIDELRVGGQTQSITVTPKGKAPAYEVAPESNNRNPAASDGQGEGRARWNIFKY